MNWKLFKLTMIIMGTLLSLAVAIVVLDAREIITFPYDLKDM